MKIINGENLWTSPVVHENHRTDCVPASTPDRQINTHRLSAPRYANSPTNHIPPSAHSHRTSAIARQKHSHQVLALHSRHTYRWTDWYGTFHNTAADCPHSRPPIPAAFRIHSKWNDAGARDRQVPRCSEMDTHSLSIALPEEREEEEGEREWSMRVCVCADKGPVGRSDKWVCVCI